ncbi:MAG: ATP--guanido phosphotransferase [Ruminococcaceae bacterium]|nr:ATP--guanido phosphotransferase [Oscillospiraceae bacterium]
MSNIVISSRIRLARNFKDYNFIYKLDEKDALKITEAVKNTVLTSSDASPSYFREITGEELKKEGGKLIEEHLISPDFMNLAIPCAVIIDNSREISIMVNEEDHLRIQVIKPGFNLKEALKIANACDDLIEEKNEYAFSEKYGYLTTCPTNVGTGLRASVMLHLPAITMCGRLEALKNNLNRLGITIRGCYGEGSKAYGNLYQISNQVTLGLSEEEITERLTGVVEKIITDEENLRESIKSDALTDKILRAEGILKSCYLLSFKEFTDLWSYVYLGMDMGIIDKKEDFYKLIASLAPNSLMEENPEARDRKRAQLIKEVI